ncbi:hypothetical protein [Frondihabitans sp. PhB188]|uniref:hypothetical protein n=1 Tax=Frondihabitans sp. PhB188 TaxID=2485200 RepID=UPI0011CECCBF|nr:hypothetical protein [Frondihabitans sp. PhB188]
MTTFFSVHSDQKQVWIAAQEGSGDHHVLVWVANDGTWRRNIGLEQDFYAFVRDLIFQEISSQDSITRLPTWPELDREKAAWLLTLLQQEQPVSSAELGL